MTLSGRIRNGDFHQYEDGQSCDDPTDVDTDAIADEVAKLEHAIQYGVDELTEMPPGIKTRRLVEILSRLKGALG